MAIDLRTAARLLGGDLSGAEVRCPGPGHSPHDRSLAVKFDGDGFVVFSHAGDDWKTCRDHVASLLSIEQHTLRSPRGRTRTPRGAAHRRAEALRLWHEATPLRVLSVNRQQETFTLGWRYLTERRGLHVGLLDPLDHCLRWHEGIGAVIALMTDPVSNKPTGIQRTFLHRDGTKRERKMLGRAGVVRPSRDEDVTKGLGITEGAEDGLAVLLSGWAPVWAAMSCNAISNFPVLSGIECLTIFHDDDAPGTKAAQECARRWTAEGREARLSKVKDVLR
jgi:putative DNA primase/helicase